MLTVRRDHQALRHPWIQEGGTAKDMFLEGSVVQRLQRFTTYGDLKQLILMKVSEELMLPGTISAAASSRQTCKRVLLL